VGTGVIPSLFAAPVRPTGRECRPRRCSVWHQVSESFDESAVDKEVGPRDVSGAIARENKSEMCDLGGLCKPARREAALAGDDSVARGVEVDQVARGCGRDAILAEPELRRDRAWADRIEADVVSAKLF
jgi:hypothetical protein